MSVATDPDRLPLTWQDQAILDLEGTADPWNIQVELSSQTPIDVVRLQRAFEAGCARHPMMRARLRRGSRWSAASEWDVSTQPEVTVEVTELSLRSDADGDLDTLRTELYSPAFDLTRDAPVRVHVVRRAGAPDLVCVAAAHPVVDGVGLLRFLRSVAADYRGTADAADTMGLHEARNLRRVLLPTSAGEAWRRFNEGGAKLAGALRSPARISTDSSDDRRGNGFAHRRVDAEAVEAVKALLPDGSTLNDALLAAAMHAVGIWNDQHGESADKVQFFMPVNLRPREWATDMVMNLVSYVSVATRLRQRGGLLETTRVVSGRTSQAARVGPALGTQDLLRVVAPVPLGIKRLMPQLLAATGHRFVDTAVVSNLGRPTDLPSFDGAPPAEIYFTPPCWSAASVAIGVISSGGHLHLGVRHRLTDLDGAAGEAFADLLVQVFTSAASDQVSRQEPPAAAAR